MTARSRRQKRHWSSFIVTAVGWVDDRIELSAVQAVIHLRSEISESRTVAKWKSKAQPYEEAEWGAILGNRYEIRDKLLPSLVPRSSMAIK
jgi:hypothetical protein